MVCETMPHTAPTYDHTQAGTAVVVILLAAALVVFASLALTTRATGGIRALPTVAVVIVGFTFVLLIAIALVFSRLNVRVEGSELSWRFRFGVQEHRVAVADIFHARVVSNPTLYGYGVRRLPNGWLYNVSGTKAVELVLRDGRTVRVGTDEPDVLLKAIGGAR